MPGSQRFPDQVAKALRAAGWPFTQDRSAKIRAWREQLEASAGFSMSSEAQLALDEFGGLDIRDRGAGVDLARVPFRLDPTVALGEEDRFARASRLVGTDLYPLGDYEDGHALIAIGRDGRVFLLMDRVWIAGPSLDEALINLILGRGIQAVGGGEGFDG